MSVRAGKAAWPKPVRRLFPRLRSLYRRCADELERLVSGVSAYICDACTAEASPVLERHRGFVGTCPVH